MMGISLGHRKLLSRRPLTLMLGFCLVQRKLVSWRPDTDVGV
jgi:hypothetical protein